MNNNNAQKIAVWFDLSTTQEGTVRDNAQEHGINESQLDWDALTQDSLQMECNAIKALKALGFRVVTEGHDAIGDLLGCLHFSSDQAHLCAIVAQGLVDPLEGEHIGCQWTKGAETVPDVYQGVSDIGRQILDIRLRCEVIRDDVNNKVMEDIKARIESGAEAYQPTHATAR